MKCSSPLNIDRNIVPCNKCYGCRYNRQAGWIFRINKEAEGHTSALFITLTYETAPLTKNGLQTLVKSDLQKFIKRIRKDNRTQVKYFGCGEYGGKTKRPHYHLILFGADREKVTEKWTQGFVHFGEVTEASISYTTKYMLKGEKEVLHPDDDRSEIFQVMSKGLGKSYLSERMIKWHKASPQNRVYLPLKDGIKVPMPRYYRQKIYTEGEWNEIRYHILLKLEMDSVNETYEQWKKKEQEKEREFRALARKKIKMNDKL